MINNCPRISVIMPVYNSQDTVHFSIRSVLNQTYDNFDFIIINDGSTDDSESVILSFKDTRIKYFKISHKGRSYASNYGISKAATEFIARIDADDLFVKEKLKSQMGFIKEHPEIDFIFSWSVFYNETDMLRFWKSPESDYDIKSKMMYLNPINHSSIIYKKDVILKLSGYNETLDINEDYDLWIRASKEYKFYCLQEYLVYSKLKDDLFKKKFDKELVLLLTKNINNIPGLERKERNDLLGRVEYYYGNPEEARKNLINGNITRNFKLLLYSYIPGLVLNKLRGKRFSLFLSKDFFRKYSFRNILKQMLAE